MNGEHANTPAPLPTETVADRDQTDGCIEGIEYFATRKINLAADSGNRGTAGSLWADILRMDISDLRLALAAERRETDQLKTALNRMVTAHENLVSDTEGKWPTPDSGCIECTRGTVPDRYNTGLCAYHNAKKVLRHAD